MAQVRAGRRVRGRGARHGSQPQLPQGAGRGRGQEHLHQRRQGGAQGDFIQGSLMMGPRQTVHRDHS